MLTGPDDFFEEKTGSSRPTGQSNAIDLDQTICSSCEALERAFLPTAWTLRVPGAAMVINAGEAILASAA